MMLEPLAVIRSHHLKGMVKYWDIGGVKEDYWIQCEDKEREWFEFNCTYLPNIGLTALFCFDMCI